MMKMFERHRVNQHYTDRNPRPSARAPELPKPASKPLIWPLFAVGLISLCFAFGHVLARYSFVHGVSISTAAVSRTGLAAILLLSLILIKGESVRPPGGQLPFRRFAMVAPIGLFIAVQTVAIQTSVSMMPVGIAILVFYTFPFFTGLGSGWLGDVRFDMRLAGTLLLALLGLALVVGIGNHVANWAGIGLALVAALGFTGALLLTPRLGAGMNASVRTFATMLSASVALALFGIARGDLNWPSTSAGQWGLVGLASCYAIAISTLFLLLPRLGAVQMAVLLNLEPVAVAILAWFTLGEALSFTQILGALLVVTAVLVYQIGSVRRQ
jgi:drug/metabolite transporter (DMT)-like permease